MPRTAAISIHAPPRGATRRSFIYSRMGRISIHAPPRGATPRAGGKSRVGNFNSRPSARGDAVLAPVPPLAMGFQFTPLREGRRGVCAANHQNQGISIHAPPRGATSTFRTPVRSAAHFNSRPSARGDRWHLGGRRELRHFNSRPSARGDSAGCQRPSRTPISIHAPPRGATRRRNSRACRWQFQFTPLREGRRGRAGRAAGAPRYFNSRPSARGDPCVPRRADGACAFQFTPLREGRL